MPIHKIDAGSAAQPPLFGAAATRRIEQAALAALPAQTLMQRAGLATARLALALAPHAHTVWVACGPGNNGGDGLEAAAHLKRWGKHVVVSWLGDEARCPADARAALGRARAAGVPFVDAPPEGLQAGDLMIDALLGIGAAPARVAQGRLADWLRRLRAGPAGLLAVDLPSGLDADTGTFAIDNEAGSSHGPVVGATFHSENTLSLLTLKPGLFTAQGRDAAGTIWFDDLGCDPGGEPPTATLLGAPLQEPRAHASHKGSFGAVAVLGGARGMGGAALLAASAALHGGAGKVFVAPLDGSALRLDPGLPELMFRRPDDLDLENAAVVCGCGGGDVVATVLPRVLADARQAVVDADALNALAADPALREAVVRRARRAQATVLTPHPLEAARLLGIDAKRVQADRLVAARQLADQFACCVVLKGSGSVIAEPGRCPAINPSGNARLATAGTGDVLAGLIGARLAAQQSAWDAACEMVWRHGRAAECWPEGEALTAGMLARCAAASTATTGCA